MFLGVALLLLICGSSVFSQPRLTSITLKGNTVWKTAELLRLSGLTPGSPFSSEKLEEGVDELLGHYDNNGYPFVKIVPEQVGIRNDSVSVILTIAEGNKARITRIQVIGNKITKEKIVLREFGFGPGDRYDGSRLERARENLMATGLFKTVSPFSMAADSSGSKLSLTVTVAEGLMNDLDGVVGYVPDEVEGGYFTGRFNVAVRNFIGTGRKVTARWEKRDRQSTDLAFTYEEPWLFGLPVTGGFSFAQLHKGTDDGIFNYSQTDLGISFRLRMARYTAGYLTLQSRGVFPDSGSLFYMGKSRTRTVTLGAEYDTRDFELNPSSGFLYGAGLGYGFRENDYDTRQVSVDAQQFFRLTPRVTAGLVTCGRLLMTGSDEPDFSDLYPLGGGSTVRGYREGQFYGSRVAWANLELKYFLDRRSAAYLFLDDGWFYRPAFTFETGPSESVQANKFGYGMGFSLFTRIGVLTLEYGLGQDDGIIDGKVHMGLAGKF